MAAGTSSTCVSVGANRPNESEASKPFEVSNKLAKQEILNRNSPLRMRIPDYSLFCARNPDYGDPLIRLGRTHFVPN